MLGSYVNRSNLTHSQWAGFGISSDFVISFYSSKLKLTNKIEEEWYEIYLSKCLFFH